MRSHARRLVADLRQIGGWVSVLFLAVLVVTTVVTYLATFAVADGRGYAETVAAAPRAALLRVIDPNNSIVTNYDSIEQVDASVLDQPALRVMTDRMARDDRMFLALPLNDFLAEFRVDRELGTRPLAVVGTAPPFLDEAPRPGEVLRWGSIAGRAPRPGVNDQVVLGYRVRQVSSQSLGATYVTGSGRIDDTQYEPMVAFDVATARGLGIRNRQAGAILDGFVCYCDTSDLTPLAEAMSEAEAATGSGRVYYAVDRDDVVGPIQRSRATAERFDAGQGVATLLSLGGVWVVVARLFWARRAPTYLVERLCGSGALAIQVRAQIPLAASLALPAIAGYELVDLLGQASEWPPPLPPEARVTAYATIAALYAVAAIPTILRIRRLCRFEDAHVRGV